MGVFEKLKKWVNGKNENVAETGSQKQTKSSAEIVKEDNANLASVFGVREDIFHHLLTSYTNATVLASGPATFMVMDTLATRTPNGSVKEYEQFRDYNFYVNTTGTVVSIDLQMSYFGRDNDITEKTLSQVVFRKNRDLTGEVYTVNLVDMRERTDYKGNYSHRVNAIETQVYRKDENGNFVCTEVLTAKNTSPSFAEGLAPVTILGQENIAKLYAEEHLGSKDEAHPEIALINNGFEVNKVTVRMKDNVACASIYNPQTGEQADVNLPLNNVCPKFYKQGGLHSGDVQNIVRNANTMTSQNVM